MEQNNTTQFSTGYGALITGFLMVALALAAQLVGYINLDDAWLLDVAGRVVGGERLGVDVIESNPPLIIYLMEAPVYLAKLFHISHVTGFIIYIEIIGLVTTVITFTQVKDTSLRLCLIFIIFFLPGVVFGEREHIFIMLAMPYFVSQWRKEKAPLWYLIVSGLLAAVGVSLKPFFVIIWLATVLTKMVLDRRFFAFLNWQDLLIGIIGGAYLLYVVFVEKTYMASVFPLIYKYYGAFGTDKIEALQQVGRLIMLFQLPFWMMFYLNRNMVTRALYFLNFGNLASIIMIALQQKTWLNYFYPAHFFGFLENILLIAAVFANSKLLWNKVAAILASIVVTVLIGYAVVANIRVGLRLADGETKQLVQMFNKYAGNKPVYVLSFDLGVIYPALNYSNAYYRGHYGHLWMMPGMFMDRPKNGDKVIFKKPEEMNVDEKNITQIVLADMKKNPPALVAVTESKYYDRRIGIFQFNLLEYFSQNAEFKDIWSHYDKLAKIGTTVVYKHKD